MIILYGFEALGQSIHLAINIAKFPQKCVQADRKSAYYSTFDAKSIEDALCYELKEGLPIVREEGQTGSWPSLKLASGNGNISGLTRNGCFIANMPIILNLKNNNVLAKEVKSDKYLIILEFEHQYFRIYLYDELSFPL